MTDQGEQFYESERSADQQEEDTEEADTGVEEGKVVAVHVDQGVDGVLVPVYEGGQDVHGAAHHHGQQQQRHQGLLGPVDEPPPRPREALALAEEVGEWQQEEERDIGQGEDQVPDAVDEAGVEPLHVPGLGIPVQHLQQTPVKTPPTVHCLGHLVADGGDGQQHGGTHRDCQGEAAAPQRDLVDPEVGGVCVREEFLILLSSATTG